MEYLPFLFVFMRPAFAGMPDITCISVRLQSGLHFLLAIFRSYATIKAEQMFDRNAKQEGRTLAVLLANPQQVAI